MKNPKRHIIILMLVTLLAACSSGHGEPELPVDPVPTDSSAMEAPMEFAAALATAQSRAAALESRHTQFQVWTYKTPAGSASQQVVMPGYLVDYQAGAWSYLERPDQYLKFWDLSADRYDFYAYAPVDGKVSASSDAAAPLRLSGIVGHVDAASAPDYIVAHLSRHIADAQGPCDIDAYTQATSTLATGYDIVPLCFHHILVPVSFRIYNVGEDEIAVKSIQVSLNNGQQIATAGDFVDGSWEATSSTPYIVNVSYLEAKTLEGEQTQADAIEISYQAEMAQPAMATDINITIETGAGKLISGNMELPESWDFDKGYVYYIKINDDGGTPILVDLEVESFDQGDIFDFTQTNW